MKKVLTSMVPLALAASLAGHVMARPSKEDSAGDLARVRGVTISCQTWGKEWGYDRFADELADLRSLGVNWVAIHPYASVGGDGSVRSLGGPLDPEHPPEWLTVPLAEARRHGMGLFVKPHLAYWGSPFAWRGEIAFEEPSARERFWREYGDWIESLARITHEAQAFSVGTELDAMLADDRPWRAVIARVRAVTSAQLTYAANWDAFERVPFWDALDAVGVQGYFPLASEGADEESLSLAALRRAWAPILERLRRLHATSGKPVVLTELGYHASPFPASRPWDDATATAAGAVEARRQTLTLFRAAFAVLDEEAAWLRGAFLWKWFVGEPYARRRTFELDTPAVRALIHEAWGGRPASDSPR